MLKWFLTLSLAVLVLGLLTSSRPEERPGRRLPGDFRVCWRGREYSFPLASTLLLSLALTVIGRLL